MILLCLTLEGPRTLSHRIKEVSQVVEELRLAVLDRFRHVRETLGDRVTNVALKMAQMGQKQVTNTWPICVGHRCARL